MSFYHRYRSAPMPVVVRVTPGGVLVGRELTVEVDFTAEALDERGLIVPEEALGRLDDLMRELFLDKVLIDNNDPYADDLMKLKRIKAVDPTLCEHGTTGPALAFFVGRRAAEWLDREKWRPEMGDVRRPVVWYATVKLGRDEFFYDMA